MFDVICDDLVSLTYTYSRFTELPDPSQLTPCSGISRILGVLEPSLNSAVKSLEKAICFLFVFLNAFLSLTRETNEKEKRWSKLCLLGSVGASMVCG
ncbi:hypothetical protein K7X08_037245 [Anisodus acutangulus]|uniref:Uncharacterized protein n=1 Tax=Anisodus acutangulus TaxID=402998 RepID=A0A9Q1MR62_9SOLA|nr:hypothetical protein K7X08_037245 [Anisodus acutangulus]